MEDMSIFEAIISQRAIRRFADDVVPDEAIKKIINAATRAPSAGNRQPWHFLVIRDPQVKKRIGEIYWEATEELRARGLSKENATFQRTGWDMAEHIGETPVLILVCMDTGGKESFALGASIFPAIQNLLLAARAIGLGSCYTSNIRQREDKIKELMGIPDGVIVAGLLPIGYPGFKEHFGGSLRKPAEEVIFYDHWGQRNY